uniref:Uncharacterized protein n=1 Tax=Brassica campestris TaxID=3711 RepID=A0A3P5Z950_BRACM|nr:unnamed protein product [Brassica rapa]
MFGVSSGAGPYRESPMTGLESLNFIDEIQQLAATFPPENTGDSSRGAFHFVFSGRRKHRSSYSPPVPEINLSPGPRRGDRCRAKRKHLR